jgi:hypothetical protein
MKGLTAGGGHRKGCGWARALYVVYGLFLWDWVFFQGLCVMVDLWEPWLAAGGVGVGAARGVCFLAPGFSLLDSGSISVGLRNRRGLF